MAKMWELEGADAPFSTRKPAGQVWALGLLTCGSSPTTAPFMQVSEF